MPGPVPLLVPDVASKFKASAWGKKLEKQTAKAAQNDFDRFKATLAKVSATLAATAAWRVCSRKQILWLYQGYGGLVV